MFFTRVAFLSLLLGMSLLCADAQVNGQMKSEQGQELQCHLRLRLWMIWLLLGG